MFGELNVPRFWIPAKNFAYAIESENTLTFVREDDGLYALAVGPHPIIESTWSRFSLSREVDRQKTVNFTLRGQWDAYGIFSHPFKDGGKIEILTDDVVINDFLHAHGPDSSVFAPNPEVIFWGAVRSDDGEIAAIGALTQWESGEHIISSVATNSQLRGQGYGAALMSGLLTHADSLKIERIGLAVYAKNDVAKRLYERIGFQSMGQFNSFEGKS